ncbi:stress-activated map kinase interacting protein 1-domain-containing protein [Cokeromyces recurvatus]|uniref:stress-activated map kinase interacting protein 1-domain-containing protein n=1 Tax=Cokeromyces recurvatus TaxID=90255 RepID=UPI002220A1BB|nr:stress-activated map kinase interacting protein 1-domain-containing protein [Cokeromyces recurvatus]KAI7898040.1 stress-activated map kinase interacting protein 1-domain-containing protein [Cokeromyces recurvatus]
MSLITDPLYIIHTSRIKFLRMDERGERIITFPPTIMSDDYVRLAAPIYPEMQYCYSPIYDSYLNNNHPLLTSSPRTTKRNYRQRKPLHLPNLVVGKGIGNKMNESSTDSEEDDGIEVDKQIKEKQLETTEAEDEETETELETAKPITMIPNRSYPTTSLHPSVDSAIDPSPRSSIDDNANASFTAFPIQEEEEEEEENTSNTTPITAIEISPEPSESKDRHKPTQQPPLEYTKKMISHPLTVSALSALIAEKATTAENPFSEYAFVSGKGEGNRSITLCVYLPHSSEPSKPMSLVVRSDAITDDVIGFILYSYVEQKRQPELEEAAYDLAEWVLLIAEEDGEIEDDLPAIDRTRNIGRVSFDQFALCRATPSQAKQNDIDRARMGRFKPDLETLKNKKALAAGGRLTAVPSQHESAENKDPTLEGSPTGGLSEENMTSHLMPQQQQPEPDPSTVAVPVPSSKATLTKATMPMTPLKYFRIKLMTNEEVSATTAIPVYAEMFIGDVLELVSRKRKLNSNEYMLMIADTNVIVPNDTTVESMKGITDLTLIKKGTALNVPTSTHLWRSPIKRKKEEVNHPMYFTTTDSRTAGASNDGLFSQYKKYTVSRKMPMFVSKRIYILAIDGDYIHLMPPEHKGMFDSVKTSSFHASAVKSCKQSKKIPANFKIVILKERDYKTYDLEAESAKEANEICSRIRFLMQVTKGT